MWYQESEVVHESEARRRNARLLSLWELFFMFRVLWYHAFSANERFTYYLCKILSRSTAPFTIRLNSYLFRVAYRLTRSVWLMIVMRLSYYCGKRTKCFIYTFLFTKDGSINKKEKYTYKQKIYNKQKRKQKKYRDRVNKGWSQTLHCIVFLTVFGF